MDAGLATLLGEMDERLAALTERNDARRHFLGLTRRTAGAVALDVQHGGCHDGAWMEQVQREYGELYLRALDEDLAGVRLQGPWATVFRYARTHPEAHPIRHLLLGANAHINYDLPQALLATVSDADLDDVRLMCHRRLDHAHIDEVAAEQVSRTEVKLAYDGARSWRERALMPAYRVAAQRLLHESRAKVWANLQVLVDSRRHGPEALRQQLLALERLAAARTDDLVEPGQVLLRVGFRGFGVLLPGASLDSTPPPT